MATRSENEHVAPDELVDTLQDGVRRGEHHVASLAVTVTTLERRLDRLEDRLDMVMRVVLDRDPGAGPTPSPPRPWLPGRTTPPQDMANVRKLQQITRIVLDG